MTEKLSKEEKADRAEKRAEARAEGKVTKEAARDSRERGFTVPDEDVK